MPTLKNRRKNGESRVWQRNLRGIFVSESPGGATRAGAERSIPKI
jgi:hypothetical protein